jgi:DNA processing protein
MLMALNRKDRTRSQELRESSYVAPTSTKSVWLRDVLHSKGRGALGPRQLEFFRDKNEGQAEDVELYYAGDLGLVKRPSVSIVDTRKATFEGRSRARRLSKELVSEGVVVMSGLARGIDGAAHQSAIEHGGRTVAVIGTPISKAYPAEHASLQTEIWKHHLLLSPFREGARVFKTNFPQRNRIMAALSDATVIVEAADGSGTLHQAAECQRLKRWLFIAQSVVDNPDLAWPKRFVGHPYVAVLTSTSDIISKIKDRRDVG